MNPADISNYCKCSQQGLILPIIIMAFELIFNIVYKLLSASYKSLSFVCILFLQVIAKRYIETRITISLNLNIHQDSPRQQIYETSIYIYIYIYTVLKLYYSKASFMYINVCIWHYFYFTIYIPREHNNMMIDLMPKQKR